MKYPEGPKHKVGVSKQIVLVRHGESEGQTSAARGLSRDDPSLLDCPLTSNGVQQARSLWPTEFPPPELIVTSPLKRALQTTLLAFPTNPAPMVCYPGIKECGGLDGYQIPENIQRPLSQLKQDADLLLFEHWPAVDMSLVQDPSTRCAEGEDGSELETQSGHYHEGRQIRQFVKWLNRREEKTIVVVCHYNVILELLGGQVDRVKNCTPMPCSIVGHGENVRLVLSKVCGALLPTEVKADRRKANRAEVRSKDGRIRKK